MKQATILICLISIALISKAQQPVPAAEVQIKMAMLAAPEEKRAGAAILGYAPDGKLVTLRKGTNEMICLADDPRQKGINVSCYHQDLEPFMQRGRELKAEGKSQPDVIKIRDEEAKAGKVKLVKQPSTLFVYSARDEDCNFETGEVKNGYLRYVIYIPYATAASTGLPLKQDAPGMPWIMDPGTPRAHIMINPPKQ